MDYNEILNFGKGPTKDVEEKQFHQNMRYSVTGQNAREGGQRKQENFGDGRESHPKSVEKIKHGNKTKDEGFHQEDARNQIMERLRAQLWQRNVKRKRRRKKKTGDKTKEEGAHNQGGETVKGELDTGEACRGINEEAEKLIPNKDVQKETKPPTEGDKHNTKVIEVDVVPSVPVNLTVDVADDNDDDDDDGFMPRRLFFFSFTQFKLQNCSSSVLKSWDG